MSNKHICLYEKTHTGTCDQPVVSAGEIYCYYHRKIVSGIIEHDPLSVIK